MTNHSIHTRKTNLFLIAFVFHLDREVEKVNSFFLYKRSELERRLRILSEKSKRHGPSSATTSSSSTTTTPAASATTGSAVNSRLDLSIVTSPKGAMAVASLASSTTPLVAPSPFISDPEADAECLHAMLQTKEMLSKTTWFATMNRRAVEKILKK